MCIQISRDNFRSLVINLLIPGLQPEAVWLFISLFVSFISIYVFAGVWGDSIHMQVSMDTTVGVMMVLGVSLGSRYCVYCSPTEQHFPSGWETNGTLEKIGECSLEDQVDISADVHTGNKGQEEAKSIITQ